MPELPGETPELRSAASGLGSFIQESGFQPERFWDELITLASEEEGVPQYAGRVLQRLGASGLPSQSLELAIRDCKHAFRMSYPDYFTEVTLRRGPIQLQWEAHGPGLLHMIGRLTEAELLVGAAEVILVQPIVGGAGYAHLKSNRVSLEAVLTNADPALPETLRLAWLLAQLDIDRPVYSDQVNSVQLRRLAGLAMIPPCLLAAQELEIGTFTNESICHALQRWAFSIEAAQRETIATVLAAWWETYETSKPDWRTALTGLQRMLDVSL